MGSYQHIYQIYLKFYILIDGTRIYYEGKFNISFQFHAHYIHISASTYLSNVSFQASVGSWISLLIYLILMMLWSWSCIKSCLKLHIFDNVLRVYPVLYNFRILYFFGIYLYDFMCRHCGLAINSFTIFSVLPEIWWFCQGSDVDW